MTITTYVNETLADQLTPEQIANPTLEAISGLDFGNSWINWMVKHAKPFHSDTYSYDMLEFKGAIKSTSAIVQLFKDFKALRDQHHSTTGEMSQITILDIFNDETEDGYTASLSIERGKWKSTANIITLTLSLYYPKTK